MHTHSNPIDKVSIIYVEGGHRYIYTLYQLIRLYCGQVYVQNLLIFVWCSSTGEVKILTKGDNNMGDDREGMIYAPRQNWVTRDEVIGRARGLVTCTVM